MSLHLGQRLDDGADFSLDPDQLVTHGVVLGMTGSGKTGLGVAMLEDLARAGVPLLLIDPKGELANLSHDLRVFTPGGALAPLDVLGSLQAPQGTDRRDLVAGTVASLLSLVGFEADPVRAPESIVLSTIIEQAWAQGQDLSLEALITRLVNPAFQKVGVFALDTFYPPEQRMKLAMLLNGVLASPAFADWTRGQPLEIDAFMAPRSVTVFYLAHLSEAERMFFVAILLERVLAWSRRQSGTPRLRALVYFDEVAGYLPPHPREPASKRPLLTLLKQARAVGLGVVLASQNPVDLDYKALGNAGTWLIGRLPTAQDRERVADGLLSGCDRSALLKAFETLGPRVFLGYLAGGSPALFRTRDTRSPLRGPLTLADLEGLCPASPPPAERAAASHPPLTPGGVLSLFARADRLQPALYAELALHFEKSGFVRDERAERVLSPGGSWRPLACELSAQAPAGASYDPLPPEWDEARELKAAQMSLVEEIRQLETRPQWVHAGFKLASLGGESREAFVARCERAVAERVAAQSGKLSERRDRELRSLDGKLAKLRDRREALTSAAQVRDTDQLLEVGQTLLGFVTGSKRTLGTVVSKHRARQKAADEAQRRLEQADRDIAQLLDQAAQVQTRFEAEVSELESRERQALDAIEERPMRLGRTGVRVVRFGIAWVPV